MPEYIGSSKDKDEEQPLDSFKKYKKKWGNDTARDDMAEDGVIDKQNKSKEICLQEYIAHRDSYQETYVGEEKNNYFIKLKKLRQVWKDA